VPSGLVFNIQRFTTHDGPGIRTTLFLKGCPMDCSWCHNPEGQSRSPHIVRFEARCIRCDRCVRVCPEETSTTLPPTVPGTTRCRLCGACVEACPAEARQRAGTTMNVAEALAELLRDQPFYDESGGGVTFSGGEPLLQKEFLLELLEACRRSGLHTALDTSGYAPQADLLAAAALSNLVLYDLKFMDDGLHRKHTKVTNTIILDNLRALAREHPRIWIRIPVIPGLNDSESEMRSLAGFAASVQHVEQVNLLPYHRTGVGKFERLNREYSLRDLQPPEAERMDSLAQIFEAHGLTVKKGGA
jgi:pyruvate formate lyase activating enzyme